MGGEKHSHRRAADAYQKSARKSPIPDNDEAQSSKDESDRLVSRGPSPKDVAPVSPADSVPEGFQKVDLGSGDSAVSDPGALPGPQRVARLLIAMGPERAASVIENLDLEEIQAVAQAVMQTPRLASEDARALLEAVGEVAQKRRTVGGPEMAREMLVQAFGEVKGEQLFRGAVPRNAPSHFDFLSELEASQLGVLFRDESPAVVAVILPHLDPNLGASVLKTLTDGQRSEVVRRIARLEPLNREVIVNMENAVREKIRLQGRQVTQAVDGSETLAAILRHMAPSEENGILGDLEATDPELSQSVRERLYTSDLVSSLSGRHLADLLRPFSDSEIALFLKGKPQIQRVAVLKALSERRREFVSEEYAHLGPQKKEDVDRITHEVMERMRELEEDGSILVPREGDRYI